MQISRHADYALRVLIFLGAHEGETVSTPKISKAYGISRHHLARVVQTLSEYGYVELIPGRGGGVKLVRSPAQIRLGDVVLHTEPNLRLVECFDPATNTCPIIHCCGLKGLLNGALREFISSLNEHTLADLMTPKRRDSLVSLFMERVSA